MKLLEALRRVREVSWAAGGHPVVETVARHLCRLCPGAAPLPGGRGGLAVGLAGDALVAARGGLPLEGEWLLLRLDGEGAGLLAASGPHLLYPLLGLVEEEWAEEPAAAFREGRVSRPASRWQRPLFDLFLNQYYRAARGADREGCVAALARAGYTHVEVNGLAFPIPFEEAEPGEVLHRFYTYCPALDQFVASRLNRGTWPAEYLAANLARLEATAALARKYGLSPTLLCFEPRSVPERLLRRWPMLRGARVDHPFRSFRPRFNLTTAHPAVREHYAELVRGLLDRVPDLSCLEIWSNDSGAAFEHTCSLYAGRNGGAYLIREWREHGDIARAAAANIVGFLRTLRDAGRAVNPAFRVSLRVEPFAAERAALEEGLEEGIDLTLQTLLAPGWEVPYPHPGHPDLAAPGTTAWHSGFAPAERAPLELLAARGVRVHVLAAPGAFGNCEPLLGLPFPGLVHEKLAALGATGVADVGLLGGAAPPGLVPFPVNDEVVRACRLQPERGLEEVLAAVARRWAGPGQAAALREAWRHAELALRAWPVPIHLYTMYGFVWYRLWTRPLVPDIEAIPEADREYYERFLLAPAHNPNRIDLARDVLFDLAGPEKALDALRRIDAGVPGPLARAAGAVASALACLAEDDPGRPVFLDLRDRLEALACWFETGRNVTAWIAGVHGFLQAAGGETRAARRALVREAVVRERANTVRLLRLWEESPVAFLPVAAEGETTFLHGAAFGDHLRRKLALMAGREDDTPRVDPGFLWRLPGFPGGGGEGGGS